MVQPPPPWAEGVLVLDPDPSSGTAGAGTVVNRPGSSYAIAMGPPQAASLTVRSTRALSDLSRLPRARPIRGSHQSRRGLVNAKATRKIATSISAQTAMNPSQPP